MLVHVRHNDAVLRVFVRRPQLLALLFTLIYYKFSAHKMQFTAIEVILLTAATGDELRNQQRND